jgi:hypothetical protein
VIVTPIDDGVPCPMGGAWHYVVDIDGERWSRGDAFYLRDHRGAPRKHTFQYLLAATDTRAESVVGYNCQYYRGHSAGFVELLSGPPSRVSLGMTDDEIEAQTIVADLLDAGLDHDAEKLLELIDVADADEIRAALDAARKRLDALGDDE